MYQPGPVSKVCYLLVAGLWFDADTLASHDMRYKRVRREANITPRRPARHQRARGQWAWRRGGVWVARAAVVCDAFRQSHRVPNPVDWLPLRFREVNVDRAWCRTWQHVDRDPILAMTGVERPMP